MSVMVAQGEQARIVATIEREAERAGFSYVRHDTQDDGLQVLTLSSLSDAARNVAFEVEQDGITRYRKAIGVGVTTGFVTGNSPPSDGRLAADIASAARDLGVKR